MRTMDSTRRGQPNSAASFSPLVYTVSTPVARVPLARGPLPGAAIIAASMQPILASGAAAAADPDPPDSEGELERTAIAPGGRAST